MEAVVAEKVRETVEEEVVCVEDQEVVEVTMVSEALVDSRASASVGRCLCCCSCQDQT